MELPNLKPLPKEKTPDPIVIPEREKEVVKSANLPNDDIKNTPMPISQHIEPVEEKEPESASSEERHEAPAPNDDPKNNPMSKSAAAPSQVENKTEEKPSDASAIADAIIMSHTATTTNRQPKHSFITIIAIIIGLIIAAAVLFLSGVIKIGDNTPAKPEQVYPSSKLAKTVCEQHENYKLDYDEDHTYIVTDINLDEEISGQYICKFESEDEEQPEDSFQFSYIALKSNYEDIEGLRNSFSSTASDYLTVLEDSEEYYKALSSTSPYIYLAVYKRAIVLLYANNIDTAETLLKELKFPDRSYATE